MPGNPNTIASQNIENAKRVAYTLTLQSCPLGVVTNDKPKLIIVMMTAKRIGHHLYARDEIRVNLLSGKQAKYLEASPPI